MSPIRVLLTMLAVVVAGIGLAVLYCYRSELGDLAHDVTAFVREQGPIPFLAALAVLPLVGVPVSAFYLAAGAVFPLWISLVVTVVGLAINITLAYWLARRWFRSGIERVLDRTRYSIPEVSPDDHVRLTLFLRLMPGPPFVLQSWILGLVEVPFPTYLAISLGTQMLISAGFIVLGSAFYRSSVGRVLIAAIIVVLAVIIIQWVRRLLARRDGPVSRPD